MKDGEGERGGGKRVNERVGGKKVNERGGKVGGLSTAYKHTSHVLKQHHLPKKGSRAEAIF